jgi:hypothetical protein
MQPIVITASPLEYTKYRKLMLADLCSKQPFLYIFLPVISFIPLIVIAVTAADEGIAAIDWQSIQIFGLMLGVSAVIWLGTWYSLRRGYRQNSALKNGTTYYLDEQGIRWESNPQGLVSWFDVTRAAKQSGQWIIMRPAASTSSEIYFLDTAGVMPPASRAELLSFLKRKGFKRI